MGRQDHGELRSAIRKRQRSILRLTNIVLFPKTIEVRGESNFVREGPNIIVGNHIGSHKDVGLLLRIVPRPIFFTANKMIFNRDDFSFLVRNHLQRHLKDFGPFLHLLFNPFYAWSSITSPRISPGSAASPSISTAAGPRPSGGAKTISSRDGPSSPSRAAAGWIPKDTNPYVKPFRRGASVMASHLFAEDHISVPVTPLAIFGTHIPFPVPGTVKVNIGAPMFIRDYLGRDANETKERFRTALQGRVMAHRICLES